MDGMVLTFLAFTFHLFQKVWKLDIGLQRVLNAVSALRLCPAPIFRSPEPPPCSNSNTQKLTPREETIGRTGALLPHGLYAALVLGRKGAS